VARRVFFIADTDFVIALFRSRKDAIETLQGMRLDQIGFSVITLFEVGRGEYHKGSKRVREFRNFFDQFHIFPFNSTIAELAAREAARLDKINQRMSDHDLFIAATAVMAGRTVLSRNAEHFRLCKGLRVQTW
jgi:predicted nucleic acid-binding protein